jgi:hypothetical protein
MTTICYLRPKPCIFHTASLILGDMRCKVPTTTLWLFILSVCLVNLESLSFVSILKKNLYSQPKEPAFISRYQSAKQNTEKSRKLETISLICILYIVNTTIQLLLFKNSLCGNKYVFASRNKQWGRVKDVHLICTRARIVKDWKWYYSIFGA